MTEDDKPSTTERVVNYLGWKLATNSDRLILLLGFSLLYIHAVTLLAGYHVNSVISGFMGWTFLGGWPAFRRFIRHPVVQLKHWYHVLRGTLKIEYVEYPDGETRVSIMKATRHNGWSWREVRPIDYQNQWNQ